MAERRKLTKRKKDVEPNELKEEAPFDDTPSPIEYEVAKYLRAKLPEKKTTLLGVKVNYFISSKAIDLLLDSKWAQREPGSELDAMFTTRDSVCEYLDLMLRHKFFHRAKKIIVKEKKKKKDVDVKESSKSKEETDTEKEKEVKKDKKVKEKKKVKLDMHMEQVVVDSNEPYVWIYEPLSIKSCLFGLLLVFGVVAVCLFPLWPSSIRSSVYYLSIAFASFLGFVLGLALLKVVIFVIIWALTFGRHHFWIFPNLTEDVGVLASFWPLYHYEYKPGGVSAEENNKPEENAEKKKKKSKKASDSGSSQEERAQLLNEDKLNEVSGNEEEEPEAEVEGEEEPENESSENDSVENNGFEIVNDQDVPEILNLKL